MMKKLIAIAVLGAVGLVGCNDKSPPGGPGATNADRDKVPNLTQPDNTFQLDPPNLATDIKQGETKTVNIGISRGKNFDQDVKFDVSGAPQGVKVTPADSVLRAGTEEMRMTIEAAKDAALGEHTITVTGTPAREGKATTANFRINVEKPD
jgi:uncharacterized membrane protein